MPHAISTAAVSEIKNTISASIAEEKFLWDSILEIPRVLNRINSTRRDAMRLISR
jgi:hypothetical protein